MSHPCPLPNPSFFYKCKPKQPSPLLPLLPPLPFPSSPLQKVFRFPEFPKPFSLLPSLFLNCLWFYLLLLLLLLLIILSEDWIYFAMWYPCNDLATWFVSDHRPLFVRLLIERTMDYQPIFFVVWFWLFLVHNLGDQARLMLWLVWFCLDLVVFWGIMVIEIDYSLQQNLK